MAADGPGVRVLWDIEGSVPLTPGQKIDTKDNLRWNGWVVVLRIGQCLVDLLER